MDGTAYILRLVIKWFLPCALWICGVLWWGILWHVRKQPRVSPQWSDALRWIAPVGGLALCAASLLLAFLKMR